MTGFWKKLMGRGDADAIERDDEEQHGSPAEMYLASEGVEGLSADELVEDRLGGEPQQLVDDEFKP